MMSVGKRSTMRWWIRGGFVVWAVVSTSWRLKSIRSRGVTPALLASDTVVIVDDSPDALTCWPNLRIRRTVLVFIVGGGVAAEAYAPLLQSLAEDGCPVVVVRLPYRLAPLKRHKLTALGRVHDILDWRDMGVGGWVVAGHSVARPWPAALGSTGRRPFGQLY